MTAKIKILLTVIISLVLLLFIKYKIDGEIVQSGFIEVETEEIRLSGDILRREYETSVRFMEKLASCRAISSAPQSLMKRRNLYSFMTLADPERGIYGSNFNLPEKASIQQSTFESLLIAKYEKELSQINDVVLRGLIVVDNIPFILVSYPIKDSNNSSVGRLSLGVYFDFEKTKFDDQFNSVVSFKRITKTKGQGLLKFINYIEKIPSGKNTYYVDRGQEGAVYIHDLWKGVKGNPLFVSVIKQSRVSLNRGQRIINMSLLVSLVISGITVLIVSSSLQLFIVRPISVLSTYASSLEKEFDLEDHKVINIQLPEEIKGLAGSFDRVLNKVTADKRALQTDNIKLKKLVKYDDLTKVVSRRSFDSSLNREWINLKESKKELSLIFCDIDYFKLYNDTYGHAKGDETLRRVATTLNNCVKRADDLVARYGGEEFVILLPGTKRAGAKAIAEKLRKAVDNSRIPHAKSETYGHVTISLGVATITSTDGLTQKGFIEMADKALYKAKVSGRNAVVVY